MNKLRDITVLKKRIGLWVLGGKKTFILASLVFLLSFAIYGQNYPDPNLKEVVINEFVPAHKTTQSADWIELYNTTDNPLLIGGMYVDDEYGRGSPLQIESGKVLGAGEVYLIEYHSLNNSGDYARFGTNLGSYNEVVYDEKNYSGSQYDKSYCRLPDGGIWSSDLQEPTPGELNQSSNGSWVNGNFEVHVLNIGQGMAQLVISPTGRTMLMDCGTNRYTNNESAEYVAGRIEELTGGKHINYIVASHLHSDHVGYFGKSGIWSLINEFGITFDKLIDRDSGTWNDLNGNGVVDYEKIKIGDTDNSYFFSDEIDCHNMGSLSSTALKWIAWVTNSSSDPKIGIAGKREIAEIGSDQIDLGAEVIVNIVQVDGEDVNMSKDYETASPVGDGGPVQGDHTDTRTSRNELKPSENDYSISIWINFGKLDYVFGGDTDGKYDISQYGYTYNDVESVVAQRINQKIEVISVNHHGSSHSTNDNYVNMLNPDVAIYNVGDNSYDHPDPSVIARLDNKGADQYYTAYGDNEIPLTAYKGTVTLSDIAIKSTDGEHYTVNYPGSSVAYIATSPDKNIAARMATIGEIEINEFLPDPDQLYSNEFIELHNTTNLPLIISGLYIDDLENGGGNIKVIPGDDIIIEPDGYYVLDNFNGYFNNGGDSVRLLGYDGTTEWEKVQYTSSSNDKSYGRNYLGVWPNTLEKMTPTPGASNY